MYSRHVRLCWIFLPDRSVRVWNIDAEKSVAVLYGHELDVVDVVCLGGNLVASGSLDKTVRIWDWQIQKEIDRFGGFDGGNNRTNRRISFTLNGNILAILSGNASQSSVDMWRLSVS